MFSCELVIGDAPASNVAGAGGAGGSGGVGGASGTSAAAGGLTGSGGMRTTGGAVGSGGVISGGGTLGGGGNVTLGGATSMPDSGAAADAGSGGRDIGDARAPETGTGGAPSCTTDVTWYEDRDGDGYGTDVSMFTCPAPPGRWALATGDCDDDEPAVNPGQKKYFGVGYPRPDSTISFDYDCSGTEEPNPQQTTAGDCGLLNLVCTSSSGYETNQRSGVGINAWCGSTKVRVCIPSALPCETSERSGEPPFTCR
ncbi:MAG TPA: hypothetical protein VHU80_19320 [Polyangiaceae bacterium]|nr:hypothetical protein [Polyangiaceae bacterium]